MGRLGLAILVVVLTSTTTALEVTKAAMESVAPRSGEPPVRSTAGSLGEQQAAPGRFQMFLAPGHSGSPFLLDTITGCIWHQVQNEQTKRTTFVEVDVENLHWSWGSGAQQILASRVDGSNLTDDQKRLLKESLQRTGCGLSNVVLTPGPGPGSSQSPAGTAPTAPSK